MKYLFPIALALAFAGCKDNPEPIPAYLDIQPFQVNAQGDANWHKITDGWLYVNGEYLGAYTLPATVPILSEGKSEVWLYPGVKKNGIISTPDIYPLLTRWESKQVELKAGEATTIQPTTTYDAGTNYAFGIGRGDFDGGSFLVLDDRDDDQVTTFSLSTDGSFAGKCILMEVDTAHPVIEVATEAVAGLPTNGSPEVWLEMHYKCDIPFRLFLAYNNAGTESYQAVYEFKTSENWNKIYFNITEALTISVSNLYRLYFVVALPSDSNGNYTQNSGSVRLDNIRLLHL